MLLEVFDDRYVTCPLSAGQLGKVCMDIVVLGSGCSKCHSTTGLVERVAKDLDIPVNISLNESKEERGRLGIHATPAVLVDGRLVHSGGIPSHEKVEVWLRPKPLDLLNDLTRHLFFSRPCKTQPAP